MFFTKTLRPFAPVPARLPPRGPCSSTCTVQKDCDLLAKLPAEIRNQIYLEVFTTRFSEHDKFNKTAHPLTFLATCHQINHEASTLAFHSHTFPLARELENTTFVALRNAISHLSEEQVNAITSLSYDLRSSYLCRDWEVSNVFVNAASLFPNLARFEVQVQRGSKSWNAMHYNPQQRGPTYKDLKNDAIDRYAPHWFAYGVVERIIGGHAYAWQTGERWKVEWPQTEADAYLDTVYDFNKEGEPVEVPFMGTEAIGNVRGVHMCPCNCGEVKWTSADVIQEGGRRVAIDTVFYGIDPSSLSKLGENDLLRIRRGTRAVILKPDVSHLPVVESGSVFGNIGATSISYEADEEYWETLRRRNWNWGALWRAMAFQKSEQSSFPGSWSLGEGDWVRMIERDEAKAADEVLPQVENITSIAKTASRTCEEPT
jgi:hypothetical protein